MNSHHLDFNPLLEAISLSLPQLVFLELKDIFTQEDDINVAESCPIHPTALLSQCTHLAHAQVKSYQHDLLFHYENAANYTIDIPRKVEPPSPFNKWELSADCRKGVVFQSNAITHEELQEMFQQHFGFEEIIFCDVEVSNALMETIIANNCDTIQTFVLHSWGCDESFDYNILQRIFINSTQLIKFDLTHYYDLFVQYTVSEAGAKLYVKNEHLTTDTALGLVESLLAVTDVDFSRCTCVDHELILSMVKFRSLSLLRS